MKRPLPSSATSLLCRAVGAVAASVVLLSPPARVSVSASTDLDENDLARKKHHYESYCVPMLKMANRADADGSGGLSRTEFARLWNGLGDIEGGGDDLVPSASTTYGYLLCQCSYTFDYPITCCDDTNAHDHDDDGPVPPTEANRWYPPEVWTEISLWKFGEYPDKTTKHYHKQFCEYVEWAMQAEGLQVNLNGALEPLEPTSVTSTVGTTMVTSTTSITAATTKTTTTTQKDTSTTTTTEKPTTKKPPNTTTMTTTEETTTTTVTEEAAVTTTELLTTGQANTTTEPSGSVDDSTTTTATATVAMAETTTTYPATTTTNESTIPTFTETAPEPIVLSFLGSTKGNVDAESLNMEEVNHAVWTVALDVLEDMGLRLLERRQLMVTFAEEISLYFESVVIGVDDVDCPEGLPYAEEEAPCLKFTYTLTPELRGGLGTSERSDDFLAEFRLAANEEGDLYEALVEEHPDTEIVGLGSPGGGIPFDEDTAMRAVALNAEDATAGGVQGSGFPVGGAVGIALAMALLLAIAVAYVVRRRRRDRVLKLDDSGLSEDIEADEVNADAEWFDEEVDEGGRGLPVRLVSPAASSLAAMGVASTVATRLSTGSSSTVVTAPTRQGGRMPTVATRLSSGETEVTITDRQAYPKKDPDI